MKNINSITNIDTAISNAIKLIEEERVGEQLGLYCRWEALNKRLLKYFRFNNVYMIAGASGHGKSYLLNMLESDFTDYTLNGKLVDDIAVLSFKFEMDAADELLRSLTGELKVSYAYLLSSQFNVNSNSYNRVTDEDLDKARTFLDKYKKRPLFFVETPVNLSEFVKIISSFTKEYPNKKLIITVDHSLLYKKVEDVSDLVMISELSHLLIEIRKRFGAMIIILNQFNNDIDRIDRKSNFALHYPQKSDIYYGNQLWWACDSVFTVYQPALSGITKYGLDKVDTTYLSDEGRSINLIDFGIIKARKGMLGRISFQNELYKGEINMWNAPILPFSM